MPTPPRPNFSPASYLASAHQTPIAVIALGLVIDLALIAAGVAWGKWWLIALGLLTGALSVRRLVGMLAARRAARAEGGKSSPR